MRARLPKHKRIQIRELKLISREETLGNITNFVALFSDRLSAMTMNIRPFTSVFESEISESLKKFALAAESFD